jgi:antitoxin VapB
VESAYNSTMALNIKDLETEQLATEVAELSKDTKTGAVRQALRERRDRLRLEGAGVGPGEKPYRGMQQWLETEIWPQIPEELKGRPPMTKEEIEEILGIGPEGY